MSGAIRALAVLITVFVLGGCTATATTSSSQPPATGVTAQAGSDVGNDRPQVTYDGLMVRRRVVIAIHANPDADLASLREQLDLAATRRHTRLTPVSASVLDPTILESLAPDLVVVLPSGATRVDAGKLIDPAFAENGRIIDKVQKYDVQSVLIHDLRFALATANPTVLAKAIAREGILSDALGTTQPPSVAVSSTSPTPGHYSATTWSNPSVAGSHAPRASRRRWSPSLPVPRPDPAWTCPGSRHRHPQSSRRPPATITEQHQQL